MNPQDKAINIVKANTKKEEILDDKIAKLITDLYQERHDEREREKKVLLDRFLISTDGKGVVFKNKL